MATRQSVARSEIARHIEGNSLLADFLQPFPNLLGKKRTAIDESFKRIAEALDKSRRTGTIQFTIRDSRKTRRWCLTMTPEGCHKSEAETERPDLEILTDTETWTTIAEGKVALLETFGQGKVRVRGDIELARHFARRVQRKTAT